MLSRRILRWRRHREMVWCVGYRAEATHEPGRCEYDIPALEAVIKLSKSITDTHILDVAAKKVEAKKLLAEIAPWIAVTVIVVIFVYAYQIQPNM